MSALVDYGASYDYELIDDYIYIYAKHKTITKASTLRPLLNAASIIHREISKQTQTYSDARTGNFSANTIAEGGARFKQKSVVIITVILFVALMSFRFLPILFSGNLGFIALTFFTVLLFALVIAMCIWVQSKRPK